MLTLLSRLFIPDYENYSSPKVRQAYGILTGSVGIFFNFFLFVLKIVAGMISHSIAITADAFNNLSDAGSSVITLIGFKMSGQEADSDHPYGHGRIEYLAGLSVSAIILIMAAELAKSSFEKILHPTLPEISPVIFLILVVSILVKLYMYFYNHKIAGAIDSSAMNWVDFRSCHRRLVRSFGRDLHLLFRRKLCPGYHQSAARSGSRPGVCHKNPQHCAFPSTDHGHSRPARSRLRSRTADDLPACGGQCPGQLCGAARSD